jgi:hypothetical protein
MPHNRDVAPSLSDHVEQQIDRLERGEFDAMPVAFADALLVEADFPGETAERVLMIVEAAIERRRRKRRFRRSLLARLRAARSDATGGTSSGTVTRSLAPVNSAVLAHQRPTAPVTRPVYEAPAPERTDHGSEIVSDSIAIVSGRSHPMMES